MAKQNIMTVASLRKLLDELSSELSGDYHIWLSSDEEGNEFLPMSQHLECCLSIDQEAKRIILFPLHR